MVTPLRTRNVKSYSEDTGRPVSTLSEKGQAGPVPKVSTGRTYSRDNNGTPTVKSDD
jgi:hypothetical protein